MTLPRARTRLACFVALAWFGAVHWGRMVDPPQQGVLIGCVLAAAGAGAALVAVARRGAGRGARALTAAGAGAVLLLVAALSAGVPAGLLRPRAWDELAAGIGDGMGALPAARIPYEGAEAWTQAVLLLGGGLLVAVAALLAFAPRARGAFGRPVVAAVALGALYAVPAVVLEAQNPFATGLVFALLLAAFLWLERVQRPAAPLAAGLVGAAVLLAMIAAPRLDGPEPLFDYEAFAQSLSADAGARYDWSHRYGPLDWPRDGREVLRVSARRRSYWKATNLTTFDGLRWIDEPRRGGVEETAINGAHREWIQPVRVTLRALRSTQFVGAGSTLSISQAPRVPVETAPGIFETGRRPLRRGDSYRAVVYTPRPSARELRSARTEVPGELRAEYLSMTVPGRGRRATVVFPAWDDDGHATAITSDAAGAAHADRAVRESAYSRTYALARELRARSATPYEFMRRVEAYLADGFVYTEDPPPAAVPLQDFLLRSKAGYCQQFSGAMALLLRMGGVPARIAAGFAPGSVDTRAREFVVRDLDAHSWVEVYFPGHGWITRDPTPAASPARSQMADVADAGADADVALGSAGGGGTAAPGGDLPRPGAAVPAAAADGEHGGGVPLAAGALAVLAPAAAALLVVIRRRRRMRRAPAGEEPALAELVRALRRTGRPVTPATTLDVLAHRFSRTPAEDYVRALRSARYGYGTAGPTRDQRAALRRELAVGLGVLGRLRAWWALPPSL